MGGWFKWIICEQDLVTVYKDDWTTAAKISGEFVIVNAGLHTLLFNMWTSTVAEKSLASLYDDVMQNTDFLPNICR